MHLHFLPLYLPADAGGATVNAASASLGLTATTPTALPGGVAGVIVPADLGLQAVTVSAIPGGVAATAGTAPLGFSATVASAVLGGTLANASSAVIGWSASVVTATPGPVTAPAASSPLGFNASVVTASGGETLAAVSSAALGLEAVGAVAVPGNLVVPTGSAALGFVAQVSIPFDPAAAKLVRPASLGLVAAGVRAWRVGHGAADAVPFGHRVIITRDGDTVDLIARRMLGDERRAGAILAANRGLARLGPRLPAGIRLIVPPVPAGRADGGRDPLAADGGTAAGVTETVTLDGDTIDLIARRALGNERLAAMILAANRGLGSLGPRLPAGMKVAVPAIAAAASGATFDRL